MARSWNLRTRLTLASMGIVAVALVVAAVAIVWLFQRQLIAKSRSLDRERAARAAAVGVYSDHYAALFIPSPPDIESGTVLLIRDGEEEMVIDRRADTSEPPPAIARLLTKAKKFAPPIHEPDTPTAFNAALVSFNACLERAGIDLQRLSLPAADEEPSDAFFRQLETLGEPLETCALALDNAFAYASQRFAARSAIIPSQDGGRCLATWVTMARANGGTPVSALIVSPLADIDRRVKGLRDGFVAGIPFLVALVGIVAWLIVGQSLQPVEAMRREVVAISHTTLDRRVPEPASQDEIGRLACTMNAMLGRLEQAAVAQHQFVSDASHELRSPIASMRAQLEVALAYPDQTNWGLTASESLEELLRMQRLVDGLLELARMDEQAPSAYLGAQEILDLDDLVFREAKRVCTRRVRTDGVSAGRVRGNPDQLRRVLRNVLENATRYAQDEIRVELTSDHGGVLLAVEDDGPGVPSHDRERIFERFIRMDESRSRVAGGAGIGLALARGIVRRHGGHMSVTQSSLGGARFEVTLPAIEG